MLLHFFRDQMLEMEKHVKQYAEHYPEKNYVQ